MSKVRIGEDAWDELANMRNKGKIDMGCPKLVMKRAPWEGALSKWFICHGPETYKRGLHFGFEVIK